jgi:hypothetical protein
MTRDINAATEAASSAEVIQPILFVKLAFDSGDVNFHSGIGPITWGGDTYTGAGRFGSINRIDEDSELSRTPITLSLSGLQSGSTSELVAALLSEHYQGRTATVYLGYLDTASNTLVDDPIIIYRGLMDTPAFDQGETLSISLNIESRFSRWDSPLVRRYNNADQQALYPGDTGLQFVEATTEKQIVWGQ